jgi:hypothetical protein
MESFSWETIAEKYEAVYHGAIATASKTAVRP